MDQSGTAVRITGINWFGFETSAYVVNGLWVYSYTRFLNQMKELGFNTLRIPFCNDMLRLQSTSLSVINYSANTDLVGLTPLQILDKVIAYCGTIGLRVILDRHSAYAGNLLAEDLWYIPGNSFYTEAQFIADWVMLAQRYLNNPTVIGFDLLNEPHFTATWGNQNPSTDWNGAAQRCGNAILSVNPKLLIIVEGTTWGRDLTKVQQFPISLTVPNKLVYSAHPYPQSIVGYDPYFYDPTYPNNLAQVWTSTWGYVHINNIAPVWVGEFGSNLQSTSDQLWMAKLKVYLNGDFNFNGTVVQPPSKGLSYAYWCLNPNSGDTGGILYDDWSSVNYQKMAYLTLDAIIV